MSLRVEVNGVVRDPSDQMKLRVQEIMPRVVVSVLRHGGDVTVGNRQGWRVEQSRATILAAWWSRV